MKREIDNVPECRSCLFHIISQLSIYSEQYSQLLKIQKRLGKDEFPLIEQTYYQSFNEMVCIHNSMWHLSII